MNSQSFKKKIHPSFRFTPLVLALLAISQPSLAATTLPADAKPTCTVNTTLFNSWFTSGAVTLNGAVNPADSLNFPNIPNCTFYQWSEQMLLWLTSPAPASYGGASVVLNSPVFYDVSTPDASGGRTLLPLTSPDLRRFGVKISQLGPQGKPVIFDSKGKLLNVIKVEAGPTGKPLLLNKAGDKVEIHKTQLSPAGKPEFLDQANQVIQFSAAKNGTPKLLDQAGKPIKMQLKSTLINGRRFFLDGAGNAVETELGQADGSVLMAQGNKLVYYALTVNDVYAYFMTGTKNGGITPAATRFPTSSTDLTKIQNFATAHSKTFPDSNALAVELKTSWIEADGMADIDKYVTINATIPTFDTSNPSLWTVNGSKQAKMALVGIHVVGSTVGHPELLWATFEHVNNSPNAAYSYTNTSNATINVAQNTAGSWLFASPGTTGPFNVPRMSESSGNIQAATGMTIGPSEVLRVNPWGTGAASGAFTGNNTDIIAINNSVINQLLPGDVRKNYLLTGTTWTPSGAVPTGGNGVGTNQMANSTMETFFQPSNCFSCHTGSNMLGTPTGDGLSHIWGPLHPLF